MAHMKFEKELNLACSRSLGTPQYENNNKCKSLIYLVLFEYENVINELCSHTLRLLGSVMIKPIASHNLEKLNLDQVLAIE